MANTLIPQTRFDDWVSEDDRIAWANQYLYWENIDVYTSPDIIQLSRGCQSAWSINAVIYNMIEIVDRVTNNTRVIGFWNDNIYHIDNGTPVYTDASMWALQYPAFSLWDYVYWVQNNGATSAFTLNKTSISDAITTTWSPTMSANTLVANDYYKYSSHVKVWNEAYISLWSNIEYLKFDGTTELFDKLISDEIVWMATTYAGILIFTETGNAILWDGSSKLIQSNIPLNIKPSAVYQYGTNIYLLWGWQLSKRGLYQFDWATAVRMYEEIRSRLISKWKLSPADSSLQVANNRDNFYLVDDKDSYDRLMIYGNEISWLNKGIHYINTVNSNDDQFNSIYCLLYSQDRLYLAWNAGGLSGVDYTNLATARNTSWYIVTSLRDYGTGIILKDNLWLYFKVRDIDATHTIEVQASYNSWDFVSVKTISVMPKDWIVRLTKKSFEKVWLKDNFEDISFKFIFSTDDTTSPKMFKWFNHNIEITNVI